MSGDKQGDFVAYMPAMNHVRIIRKRTLRYRSDNNFKFTDISCSYVTGRTRAVAFVASEY